MDPPPSRTPRANAHVSVSRWIAARGVLQTGLGGDAQRARDAIERIASVLGVEDPWEQPQPRSAQSTRRADDGGDQPPSARRRKAHLNKSRWPAVCDAVRAAATDDPGVADDVASGGDPGDHVLTRLADALGFDPEASTYTPSAAAAVMRWRARQVEATGQSMSAVTGTQRRRREAAAELKRLRAEVEQLRAAAGGTTFHTAPPAFNGPAAAPRAWPP